MSERPAQARAEAALDAFYKARWERKERLDPIRFGVGWADANPQPRTITRAEFEKAYEARFMPDPTVALNVLGFLRELGIEVEDDDE